MWIRVVLGAVLVVIGAVWIAQGVGVLHGSPMTGEAVWALIGAPLVIVGLALLRSARASK